MLEVTYNDGNTQTCSYVCFGGLDGYVQLYESDDSVICSVRYSTVDKITEK